MNILLFGPPGSGKSTHAKRIVERYGLTYISSGDIIRSEIEKKTALGVEMDNYLSRGELIPDTIVNTLIISKLRRQRENFILDGYPRTPEQVIALENYLYDHGIRLDLAMEIFIDLDTSIERISGRRICSNCGAVYHIKFKPPKEESTCDICGGRLIQRKDDMPQIVERRYRIYISNMDPIIKFYKNKGIYVRIEGSGAIDEVWKRIQPLLDYIKSRENFSQAFP